MQRTHNLCLLFTIQKLYCSLCLLTGKEFIEIEKHLNVTPDHQLIKVSLNSHAYSSIVMLRHQSQPDWSDFT